MKPAARLQAAIDILDRWAHAAPQQSKNRPPKDRPPMDRLLAAWARENRYAGSKDRAAIADRVYGVLRRWRSLGAVGADAADGGARGRVLAALLAEGEGGAAIPALFNGDRHAPAPLTEAERAMLSAPPPADAPPDWPDWLLPALEASVADPRAEIAAQTARAPVDLRVNAAKADLAAAQDRLRAEAAAAGMAVTAAPGPVSPWCLRLSAPAPVQRLALFEDGWIEPQDAASQAIALLAAAAALEVGAAPRVLDLCAGGGGKALAMAAALGPSALIDAFDIEPARMADLAPRARRAGAAISRISAADLSRRIGAYDLVLIDAPCSGSGAWARNPDAKWRLTPDRLAALQETQAAVLRRGAALVRPGGALVYATCSLLRAENEDQAQRFLAEADHAPKTAFSPKSLAPLWWAAGLLGDPPPAHQARFSPAVTATDGFFVAAFTRSGPMAAATGC